MITGGNKLFYVLLLQVNSHTLSSFSAQGNGQRKFISCRLSARAVNLIGGLEGIRLQMGASPTVEFPSARATARHWQIA